jgi:hypothetical protein
MGYYLYKAKFVAGSEVRVAARDVLEEFLREWKYHHPLAPEQLEFAGRIATVRSVGFYHGGDALYELIGVPGMWHEQCLMSAE